MINASFLILALTLLAKCSAHFSSLALPLGTTEQDEADLESLGAELGEEPGVLTSRRSSLVEGRLADEDRRKRISMFLDLGLRGAVGGESRPAAGLPLPVLSLRRRDHTPTGVLKEDRYDANDLIPMARRDLDPLRCMIGRVYRPCWKT